MLFSIIVPVYNIEKYINECLDSVLKQTCNDYEVIVVDDGSTDSSSEIIKRYSEKYDVIKYVYKKNGGLSDARNVGLAHAKGQYIIFLDGDDYWLKDVFLEDIRTFLLTHKKKLDVIIFNGKRFWDEGNNRRFSNIEVAKNRTLDPDVLYTGKKYLKMYLEGADVPSWFAWRYVVSRDILLDRNLQFPFGYVYEDVYLTWRIFINANYIGILDEFYYAYRQEREGAITSDISLRTMKDLMWVTKSNIEDTEKLVNDKYLAKLLCATFAKNYYMCLISYYTLDRKERKEFMQMLKKNEWIMEHSTRGRWHLIRKLIKILGFEPVLIILHIRAVIRKK